jgi:hypothetical protein
VQRVIPEPFEADESIVVRGIPYIPTRAVLSRLRITRQTLWRWRKEGKVPLGKRYRDKQLVFSLSEITDIVEYAERVEEIPSSDQKQLKLGLR